MSRTIVITGGTSGIGLALKDLFEKNGDLVYTLSIDEIESENHYQGSVSHEIKVNQVFNDIHEKHNTIDMLINCAGFGMSAITEIAPMEKIKDVMDVNFFGTLYCTRAALKYMTPGARIVNLSSAMALFPVPFKSIYGASKSAVLNLSMTMKMELAPAGIDVVAICPGDTKTNFTKNRIKEFETTERYGERLKTSTEHNDSKEDKRMDVSVVAEKIFKLINKKKTKPFYIIGKKYKFLYFLTRLTPKSLLINITGKKLGGKFVEEQPKKVKKVKVPKVTEEAVVTENEDAVSVNNDVLENTLVTTPTTEENTEQPTTIENNTEAQEEAKNNISSILSKITILNKPSEQTTEETAKEEVKTVESEANNTEEVKTEEATDNTTTEETPTVKVEDNTTNETTSEEKIATPSEPETPVAEKKPAEEPIVSNIQFDDEDE